MKKLIVTIISSSSLLGFLEPFHAMQPHDVSLIYWIDLVWIFQCFCAKIFVLFLDYGKNFFMNYGKNFHKFLSLSEAL